MRLFWKAVAISLIDSGVISVGFILFNFEIFAQRLWTGFTLLQF
jgi:hypothetical protein